MLRSALRLVTRPVTSRILRVSGYGTWISIPFVGPVLLIDERGRVWPRWRI